MEMTAAAAGRWQPCRPVWIRLRTVDASLGTSHRPGSRQWLVRLLKEGHSEGVKREMEKQMLYYKCTGKEGSANKEVVNTSCATSGK